MRTACHLRYSVALLICSPGCRAFSRSTKSPVRLLSLGRSRGGTPGHSATVSIQNAIWPRCSTVYASSSLRPGGRLPALMRRTAVSQRRRCLRLFALLHVPAMLGVEGEGGYCDLVLRTAILVYDLCRLKSSRADFSLNGCDSAFH